MTNQIIPIQIDLIDDPVDAMRTQTDEMALQDLADSIKTNGLIQPIILKKVGSRYEVVAGHRRLQAHRLLKATHVEAIVKNYTDIQAESAKVHENLFREDVNPVDQATFMARYLDKTQSTLADLAKMLNRTEQWVQARLEILTYPDYLIDEVYKGKISLGAAAWLNQIPNETTRREYTRFAAIQGINIKTAKRWAELAFDGRLNLNPTEQVVSTDEQGAPITVPKIRCVLCGHLDDMVTMETDFLHPSCRDTYGDELDRAHNEQTRGDSTASFSP